MSNPHDAADAVEDVGKNMGCCGCLVMILGFLALTLLFL